MAVAQGYGKTVTSGSVFAYDTGDTRNSYSGRPTVNVLAGYTLYNYNNVPGNVTTAIEATGETYKGAAVLKQTITPLDATGVSYLTNGNNPGIGIYTAGGGGTGGQYSGYSIFFKPVGPMYSSPIFTHYSNIAGWQSTSDYESMGDGWFRAKVLWYYGSTLYDQKYWAINPAGATANVPITIYWAGPFRENLNSTTISQFVEGTRSSTQGLLPLVGNSTINLSNVSFDSNAQMVFDGTNDYVNLGASSNWAFGGNGTVELMVKPTDSTGNNRLWCVDNNSTSLDAFLDGTSYKIFLHGGVVGTLTPLTQNAWNHVVVTYTGGTVQIYINGTPATMDGTTTGYSMSNSGTLYLGCYTDLAYNLYGEIPIFKTYNRALTTSEIKQNFKHYRTRFGMEYDTYYFAVSNRNARYVQQWWEQEPILDEEGNPTGEYITLDEGFVKGKNMAATTPAYTLYRKPGATNTGPGDYVEVARDDIGTPARLTQYGLQTKYPTGRYFTSVTVRKDNATGEIISFEFPDGGTSQYGEAFYKTIITPYVP